MKTTAVILLLIGLIFLVIGSVGIIQNYNDIPWYVPFLTGSTAFVAFGALVKKLSNE